MNGPRRFTPAEVRFARVLWSIFALAFGAAAAQAVIAEGPGDHVFLTAGTLFLLSCAALVGPGQTSARVLRWLAWC